MHSSRNCKLVLIHGWTILPNSSNRTKSLQFEKKINWLGKSSHQISLNMSDLGFKSNESQKLSSIVLDNQIHIYHIVNITCKYIHIQELYISNNFYPPQTRMQKGNVFTGVCLSKGEVGSVGLCQRGPHDKFPLDIDTLGRDPTKPYI